MEYSLGSEWRRWDLHIHTPGTQKNNQFTGRTLEEQWQNFYKDILDYINSCDETRQVAVLGITDYFSIENYRKVMSDNVLTTKFDLILPNIEMRVTPVSKNAALNIHLICNPQIVSELDSKLFCQLSFKHSNGKIFHPIREDLIKLGKLSSPSARSDQQAYKEGINQFVVELGELKTILQDDKELRENVIIAVSNSSNDGVSGIKYSNSIKDDIYYFSDAIFSSSNNDAKYFLGEITSPDDIIRKYGKLKPCIHGCDAHSNDKILKPDNDAFCWIKADCTFNGLKQIIYEPEERVRISPTKPENKKDYNIIEKVIINDERFSTKPIMFNSNLACLIGGKSTGKSIILNNMVKNIDYDQYKEKFDGNEFDIKNLKVYWKDGFISDGLTEKRNIVYIPQTYLNKLSDNQEEKDEIDKIIQDVVLQDEEIKQKYMEFNNNLESATRDLDTDIYDLIKANKTINDLCNELKANGNVETVTNAIKKLQTQRDQISKFLKINEEDLKEYDSLKKAQKDLDQTLYWGKQDISTLKAMNIDVYVGQDHVRLSDKLHEKLNDFISMHKKQLQEELQSFLQNEISAITVENEKIEEQILSINKDLAEKEKVLKQTENLQQITNSINEEEKQLKTAVDLEHRLQKQQEIFNNLLQNVTHKIAVFEQLHQGYVSVVNKKTSEFDDSLKFIATAPFRLEKFDEKVRSLFNNKKLKQIYNLYEDGMPTDVDEKMLKDFILPLFSPEGTSYLKSGITLEEALRNILSNWYNIVYTVELDNDKIQTMSPGKKALVLLKLLINLADSECPILIDQPEDDLDNRSIYDELVGFIRKKKYDRQIILVTHNANIVLGADTEEVIVANQEGANSPNETFRFEYRSGAIENNNILYEESGEIKKGILNQKGIQGHICEILEGGKEAFNVRKNKYTLI